MAKTLSGETETELPYSEVRKIFAKTAIQLGLQEEWAAVFGQSVWHLCNRGDPGVTNAILFLMVNKDVLTEVWGDSGHPYSNEPLSQICPIRAAVLIQQRLDRAEEEGRLEDFSLTIARSAFPVLSLPYVAFYLKQKNCGFEAIQVTGPSATVSMSDAGMSEVSDTRAHEFAWVGSKKDIEEPVLYTLARSVNSGDGLFYPKVRHETLRMPTNRLKDDGTLRL